MIGDTETLVKIEHLDDVLPHLPEDGFTHYKFDTYSSIDYNLIAKGVFDEALNRQCRGIKFDASGKLIARPFHKFFNLGERQTLDEIDWSVPHRIEDKMDGSMIHPAVVEGKLVFMTRRGITEQSEAAFAIASKQVQDFCLAMIDAGITPIFEYTAPDNRIVVKYDDARLSLLSAREMVSGRYLRFAELEDAAAPFGLHIVPSMGQVTGDPETFLQETRDLVDKEGYVISFEDGHKIKIKATLYTRCHHVLSYPSHEHNILGLVINNEIDDLIPVLPERFAEAILAYADHVIPEIDRRYKEVEAFYEEHKHLEGKEYALAVFDKLDKRLSAMCFAMNSGRDAKALQMQQLERAANSTTKLEEIRDLYGLKWDFRDSFI